MLSKAIVHRIGLFNQYDFWNLKLLHQLQCNIKKSTMIIINMPESCEIPKSEKEIQVFRYMELY